MNPKPKPLFEVNSMVKCPIGLSIVNFILANDEGYLYHTDCGWWHEEELRSLSDANAN